MAITRGNGREPARVGGDSSPRPRNGFPARVSFEPQHPRHSSYGHGSLQPRTSSAGLALVHFNLALRASSTNSTRGWYAVMKQMQRTMRAVHDAQVARGELLDATRNNELVAAHLDPYTDVPANADAPVTPPARRAPAVRASTRQTGGPVQLPHRGIALGERPGLPGRHGPSTDLRRGHER